MGDASGGPRRVLGVFDASCVVIGAIIGVGIFFTPSKIVTLTGSGGVALLAWAVAGVIALCGAFVFAELGSRFNAAGAQYEILRRTYGPMVAFMFVFCNATAIQAGAAAIIAAVCVMNVAAAMGLEAPSGWRLVALSSLLIAAVTGANVWGVKAGSRLQNITVVSKLITLLAVVGCAVMATLGWETAGGDVPEAPLQTTLSPVMGIMASLSIAFFAYGGWQHALWISGEVKNPERTLPKAILGGVGIVIVVYLLANWAYLQLLGDSGVSTSKTLAADAVGAVWPSYGRQVIAGAVAFSALGVLNAQLLSGPRLVYRMATEGQFFRVFDRVSRSGTPVAAIVLIGVMAIALFAAAGFDAVDKLTSGVVFIDGIFFALTATCLLVERRRERLTGGGQTGEVRRIYRAPFHPFAPVVFIAGELALLTGAYFDAGLRAAAWIGLAWVAASVVLYAAVFRKAATS
ncbi:MAG: Serine/threonine exchanger SteT [Phycisphaerales bacterium]|nr:Serine/threonine exchanger SteT [Phycisphaerales bacterium]